MLHFKQLQTFSHLLCKNNAFDIWLVSLGQINQLWPQRVIWRNFQDGGETLFFFFFKTLENQTSGFPIYTETNEHSWVMLNFHVFCCTNWMNAQCTIYIYNNNCVSINTLVSTYFACFIILRQTIANIWNHITLVSLQVLNNEWG